MRTAQDIRKELGEAKLALDGVRGTQTEVYSRIVGYYRSVRNWNRGKREEYSQRVTFVVDGRGRPAEAPRESRHAGGSEAPASPVAAVARSAAAEAERLLLFVRASCPKCPAAKKAAAAAPWQVELVDADTPEGLAEAARRGVYATPTALLLDGAGVELARAMDAREIAALSSPAAAPRRPRSTGALSASENPASV